jgi:hypothetical protein
LTYLVVLKFYSTAVLVRLLGEDRDMHFVDGLIMVYSASSHDFRLGEVTSAKRMSQIDIAHVCIIGLRDEDVTASLATFYLEKLVEF